MESESSKYIIGYKLPGKTVKRLAELAKMNGQRRLTAEERKAVIFLSLSPKEWDAYERYLNENAIEREEKIASKKKEASSLVETADY